MNGKPTYRKNGVNDGLVRITAGHKGIPISIKNQQRGLITKLGDLLIRIVAVLKNRYLDLIAREVLVGTRGTKNVVSQTSGYKQPACDKQCRDGDAVNNPVADARNNV